MRKYYLEKMGLEDYQYILKESTNQADAVFYDDIVCWLEMMGLEYISQNGSLVINGRSIEMPLSCHIDAKKAILKHIMEIYNESI